MRFRRAGKCVKVGEELGVPVDPLLGMQITKNTMKSWPLSIFPAVSVAVSVFYFFFFLFLKISIWLSVWHVSVGAFGDQKRVESFGAGVTGDCEPP